MKNILMVAAASALISLACAAEQNDWPAPYRPFKGEYTIYSGGLGDQQAPTRDDRKLSFIVQGQPAKDIFDSMSPDDKHTCSDEKGARSRTKGSAWCTYSPGDGYSCYFGIDLRTGKSIAGGTC